MAENEESDADPRLGAQPGRGAARRICNGRQSVRDYDVSAIDAAVESLARAPTKGDAPDRGKNSPRARRTLPQAGQIERSASPGACNPRAIRGPVMALWL